MEVAKDVISTIVATAFSVSVGQPFDTLKVRIQVASGGSTLLGFVRTILKEDGIFSLWRGSTVAFFGQICENTTSFALNAQFQRFLGPQPENEISFLRSFLVGSAAGMCTSIIVCPIETIKCKVQVAQATSMNSHCVRSTIKEMLKSQGVRGLYQGLFPQMSRDIPGSAIYFGFYDVLYHLFTSSMNFGPNESCLLAGGFAGQIYWLTSLPMDRVKSIIQTQRYDFMPSHQIRFLQATAPPGPFEGYRVGAEVAKLLYQNHGIQGFYRGGTFALIRAFPTNASLFYAYKSTRSILDNSWSDQ